MGGYEFYIKNQWLLGESKGIFATIKLYFASNIYSTILAGVITGPVVINQFYTFATYSVIMNLIAVPIMSFFLMPLSIISVFLMFFNLEYYSLKLMDFFIDLIIQSVKFNHTLPLPVWYFGYISNISILTFLFGFFWFCLWKTKWRFSGIIIILISFILMNNFPLSNFIIDNKMNVVGIKNSNSKLEIHTYSTNDPKPTNSISAFKRLYWAQWFGQNDVKIFYSKQNIFTSEKQKLIVNSSLTQSCENADIYLNLADNNNCQGNKLTITKESLADNETMLIFCNQKQCKIKTKTNKRFSL
ncbi:MAG: ComEC/Rec2 family competence protein [Candidatus Rickettsia vulgarisii]